MTSEDALKLLTPEALKAWLRSKEPLAPIGYERRQCACPIALFFQEKHGLTVHVGNWVDRLTFNVAEQPRVDLPEWAVDFANTVDEGYASRLIPLSDQNVTESEAQTRNYYYEEGIGWGEFRPVAEEMLLLLEEY